MLMSDGERLRYSVGAARAGACQRNSLGALTGLFCFQPPLPLFLIHLTLPSAMDAKSLSEQEKDIRDLLRRAERTPVKTSALVSLRPSSNSYISPFATNHVCSPLHRGEIP